MLKGISSLFAILLVLVAVGIGVSGYIIVKQSPTTTTIPIRTTTTIIPETTSTTPVTTTLSLLPTNLWNNPNHVFHFSGDSYSSIDEIKDYSVGNPSFTVDRIFGNILSLNGSGEGLVFPGISDMPISPTQWSVDFWFYRKGTGDKTIDPYTGEGFIFSTYNYDRLGFQIGDLYGRGLLFFWNYQGSVCETPQAMTSGDEFKDQTWQYGAVVCNKTHVLLYLNGDLRNSTSCNCPEFVSFPEENVAIGVDLRDRRGYGFNGLIDEVRVWRRVLTEDEILDNWEAGR